MFAQNKTVDKRLDRIVDEADETEMDAFAREIRDGEVMGFRSWWRWRLEDGCGRYNGGR